MPSKKRKYNARFPAGRIKKIMQTDEEVGKVAQAVPIIISVLSSTPRTLELFVESLLKKALQVTTSRNAKTLSPSHVKQCILAETRFDFLRDLVKNIPDVSAAEEREQMSAETSPNTSRFPDAPPRRIAREDSSSSSSGEIIRVSAVSNSSPREHLKRGISETETPNKIIKIEPAGSSITDLCTPRTPIKTEPGLPSTSVMATTPDPQMSPILAKIKQKIMSSQAMEPMDTAIDLSKKEVRTANFYQETLVDVAQSSVIKINPIYASQPSTSYTSLNPVEPVRKVSVPSVPNCDWPHFLSPITETPRTPISPVINIDFSNMTRPVIKVLDETTAVAPKNEKIKFSRQNSKSRIEVKKAEPKPAIPVDIDSLNSGNLQIDEDYDT